MQQFQEKHEVPRPDGMAGIDQPHTASVGMHQGNVGDLLFQMIHGGRYQIFQMGYINKKYTC